LSIRKYVALSYCSSRILAFGLYAGILALGCNVPPATVPNGSNAPIDASLLLSYQGKLRGLFDDGIDTEVFGAPDEGDATDEPRLTERVRASKVVVVVVVTTVNDEFYSQDGRLDIEFTPAEKPIYGSLTSFTDGTEPLHVNVNPGTGSFVLLRSNQSDLIGKRLILFLGRFLENGIPVIHWHAVADGPKVRNVVTTAASMADLEK
jgi:hypothetical protein